MAKKKPKKANHASVLRRGKKTADQLQHHAEVLREQAASLDAASQAISELTFAAIPMDGVKKIENGLRLVDEFIIKLQVAIESEKSKRRRNSPSD